jgi:molybdate transport system substrate-binding protein
MQRNAKAAWTARSGPLWEKAASQSAPTEMLWACTIGFPWLVSMDQEAELKRAPKAIRFTSCAVLAACTVLSTTWGWTQEKKSAPELTVAAAADLSTALKEMGEGYEKKTGVKVNLSFGASGALTQQIQNGAPFDLFFSADMDYPRQLIAAGDADAASLYQYAVGKLVLWVPAESSLDVEHQGMNVLLDRSVKKIAIANPQHAPYGRAAVAALKHAGVYDRITDRLVLGENVSQAAQFVESDNAQAGFVALAHAVAPGMRGKGKYWEVPLDFYPPLAQGVIVISHSQHKKEAEEFLEYVKTKEAAELLRKYGFTLPHE